MKLLIHDYSKEEWNKVASNYSDWEIISDNGKIRPCAGCFGCWIKEPGECVIKDGYERVAALFHEADEITVVSRYTYGGFSSFVKNVFDRVIGFVLPFFEVYEGEMHHKKRYSKDAVVRFVFRGNGLTDADKDKARQYVRAVCRNLHGEISGIEFEEIEKEAESMEVKAANQDTSDKAVLLNCSSRGNNANSFKFLNKLSESIEGEKEIINLVSYNGREDELLEQLRSARRLVLGMPLYVDGIPSNTLRIMEKLEKCAKASDKKVYVVSNMGMYESSQLKNLMSMVRDWCGKCGYEYCGGIAIGAGEMMGAMMKAADIKKGPTRNIASGLDALAKAISSSSSIEDIYADAYKFPRAIYMFIANSFWPRRGKENGLKKKDLLRGAV
ncbi:MAG: flavodoxin family protein [Butyrivibrio sp.]|nr:flavodoxin family protein [Butyrivibrio sp.]